MSTTKYCPYTNKDWPIDAQNPEHIVPKALGGNDRFTIPVSKDANSRFGSQIDGEFANQELVKAFRVWHGLEGHSGTTPALRIERTIELPIIGKRALTIELSKGKITYEIPLRVTETNDPAKKYISAGSLEEIRQALLKTVNRAKEKSLQVNVIENREEEIEMPKHVWINCSKISCYRFMAKVAIGAAAFYLGDSTRTMGSLNDLRAIISIAKDASIDTNTDVIQVLCLVEQDKKFSIEELFPQSQTVWISQTAAGLHAFVSFFGIITARIQIAAPESFRLTVPDKIYVCNYATAKFSEFEGQRFCEMRGIADLSPDKFYCTPIEKAWFR